MVRPYVNCFDKRRRASRPDTPTRDKLTIPAQTSQVPRSLQRYPRQGFQSSANGSVPGDGEAGQAYHPNKADYPARHRGGQYSRRRSAPPPRANPRDRNSKDWSAEAPYGQTGLQGRAFSKKLSTTRFSPTLSKATVTFAPSIETTSPSPNFWWNTRSPVE
jgi:hypothetical protein